jgi:hypothetical protein
MNAIQFIQQHGVEKAREVVSGAPERATTVKPSLDFKHFMYGICEEAGGAYILLSDLNRIVESVDLVKRYRGIAEVKTLHQDEFWNEMVFERLKQAIADYEAIGGEHV